MSVSSNFHVPEHSIPLFPKTAMVGSLGTLADILAKGTEVPEEFLFACALTIFGARSVGKLQLNIGLPTEPRLYTILLGKSYEPCKSTAQRRVIEFFLPLLPNMQVLHGFKKKYAAFSGGLKMDSPGASWRN